MGENLDNSSRDRGRLAPLATTVAAWLVAFGVVTALLTLFGEELGSLPLALRALVISGVLVTLMVNLVMPILSVAVARWVRGAPQPRVPVGAGSRPRPAHYPPQYPIDVGMAVRMGDFDAAAAAESPASNPDIREDGCERPRPARSRLATNEEEKTARCRRSLPQAHASLIWPLPRATRLMKRR
jgi:hypothetical protein